ncbi:MAG TPA: S53 family peptidase [Pseudonocardiaceae bacterium]|nr:S53 family peptidase [Pseudonocardiaceae bacterium]
MATVAAVSAAITVAAGVTALSAGVAAAATPQRIGPAPVVPHGAVRTGTPADTTSLHLDVELAPRDPAALAAFVASVSDPKSLGYKHYLAKGQFAAEFGPTQATIDAVTNALRAQGLHPGVPTPDGLTIPVTTTVAQAGSALGTGFANYRMPDGRATIVNTAAPALPASVAGSVTGIVGLNNIVKIAPHHITSDRRPVPSGSTAPRAVTPRAVTPHLASPSICASAKTFLAEPTSPGANDGWTDGVTYWEPGTLSPSKAYNTAQMYGGYGDTGQNVTVGLFEAEAFSANDIAQFQSCMGTKVPVSKVKVDGGPSLEPGVTNNTGEESALDIDAVAGMAPGVSITVYQGPDGASDENAIDMYQRMVTDDTAQVLSTSWGGCESNIELSDPGVIGSLSTIFEQAAAQGQTVVASSGDEGSTDCYTEPASLVADSTLSVDIPAGLADVTAVGGSTLQLNGTSPDLQSTWNTPEETDDQGDVFLGAASGGGVSAVTKLSGDGNYQANVQGPGYNDACHAAGDDPPATCRQVPDVSALADADSGYLIWWGQDSQNAIEFFLHVGGTSLAAPLWAAIAALADSGTACSANGSAGFLNPALYAQAAALTDITFGSNVVADSGIGGNQYQAGIGYDLATGLGTPNAAKVVEAVCGPKGAAPGSDYVPVQPHRILDTRSRIGVGTTTPIAANTALKLQITGANGVPATGVTAVVLNVTAVTPTDSSFLTVFPDGTARPGSSNLNFNKGQTIPNLVTVQVGNDGKVDLYNHVGTVHALADLEGYYTTDTTVAGASTYKPVTPARLLDTRSANGVTTTTPIGAGKHVALQVTGRGGVPATGVTGVILNVTATAPTQSSFLTVYPDGAAQPTVSNLNFTPGETIPNLVVVPVGGNGKVDIFNHVGTTHALADVEGYFTSDGTGLKFHASAPHRLLDTRIGEGVATGQKSPIGAGATLGLPINDVDGAGNLGPLATAGGAVLNVVVTAPTATSFLTVFPSSARLPGVSSLNFTKGQTIPNAVMTPIGGNFVDVFNHVGSVQVVVDLFGYFAAS